MPDMTQSTDHTEALWRASDVERLTGLARPTIYELAQRYPEALGVVRFGRVVRFRPSVVRRLIEDGGIRPS